MTEFSKYIDRLLQPKITEDTIVLDLFAGCGGLSLGFEAAGFKTVGFEMVEEAVNSYNTNLKGDCFKQFLEAGFEYPNTDNIDIVIGGPPCQPFSRFGNQKGIEDARDGFPIFIDAVKRIRPKVFVIENVANFWAGINGTLTLLLRSYRSRSILLISRLSMRLIMVFHRIENA